MTSIFELIADPTRRRVLELLRVGERRYPLRSGPLAELDRWLAPFRDGWTG